MSNQQYDGHRIATKDQLSIDVKAIDEDARTVKAIISTDSLDRDGEVVITKGLDLAEFKNNPIVLLGHDQDKPIGTAEWVVA